MFLLLVFFSRERGWFFSLFVRFSREVGCRDKYRSKTRMVETELGNSSCIYSQSLLITSHMLTDLSSIKELGRGGGKERKPPSSYQIFDDAYKRIELTFSPTVCVYLWLCRHTWTQMWPLAFLALLQRLRTGVTLCDTRVLLRRRISPTHSLWRII